MSISYEKHMRRFVRGNSAMTKSILNKDIIKSYIKEDTAEFVKLEGWFNIYRVEFSEELFNFNPALSISEYLIELLCEFADSENGKYYIYIRTCENEYNGYHNIVSRKYLDIVDPRNLNKFFDGRHLDVDLGNALTEVFEKVSYKKCRKLREEWIANGEKIDFEYDQSRYGVDLAYTSYCNKLKHDGQLFRVEL